MKKSIGSLLLILAMVFTFAAPAFATETAPVAAEVDAADGGEELSGGESVLTETDFADETPETEETPAAEEPTETEDEASEETVLSEEAVPSDDTGELASPVTDGSTEEQERAIAAKILSDDMSDYDKLYAITKYAADNFAYSSNYTAASLLRDGSGNCIANTEFIVDMCKIAGIEAWSRKAGMDAGASSGHVCAIALIDGEYYIGDAGYSNSKPRSFDVTQVPSGMSITDGVLYQYDGVGVEHLVIPSTAPTAKIVKRNQTYTKGGESITQIGQSGNACFDYNGTGDSLKSITLPSTVKTVTGTAFKGCDNLENIYVAADNPYFTSIDGVLYSKDLTRLVCVPAKKTSIVMPGTVTSQDADAFYGGKITVTVSSGTLPFTDVSNQWFADSVEFVYTHSLFKGTSSTKFSPQDTMTRGMFIAVLGRFAGGGTWQELESWSGTLGIVNANGVAIRDKTTTDGNLLTRVSSGTFVDVLERVDMGEDGSVWYKVKYGGTTGYIREKSTAASGTTLLLVYAGGLNDLQDGQYYTGYAQWANIHDIMNGMSETKYRPNKNIRRQDICVLFYRYLEYLGIEISVGGGEMFEDDDDIMEYAKCAVYVMREIGVVEGYPGNTFKPRANATRAEVATMFENLYNYLDKR